MCDRDELEAFESKWKKIDEIGLQKVLDYSKHIQIVKPYNIPKGEYMELYTTIYDILISKNQEIRKLFSQRLTSTFKYECQNMYEQLISNFSIYTFIDKWNVYENILVKWTMKVFTYFSRIKLLVQKDSSLEKEIREIFKNEVYLRLADQLKSNFLDILAKFRKGEVQPDLGKLKMFISFLDYFEDNQFQEEIIKTTQEYYTELVKENYTNSYTTYLAFGMKVIQFESTNLMLILPSLTISTIINNLNEILFFSHGKDLLEMIDGFYYLLNIKDYENLKYTFGIFSRCDKTQHILLDIFKKFVKEKFQAIVTKFNLDSTNKNASPLQVATESKFLEEYYDFQAMILDLIEISFLKNNLFYVAFKEALEEIEVKQNNINTSYLLPYYLDKYLRKSNNLFSTIDEAKQKIEKSLLLFPYIPEKDIFIMIHRNLLSYRILNSDIKSMEPEEFLLKKLKEQCGDEYTMNIDTMIKDSEMNKEFQQEYDIYFKNYLNSVQQSANININININNLIDNSFVVLTEENWPQLSVNKVKLPQPLVDLKDIMIKFYDSKQAGRKLKFSFHNSLIEIESVFNNKNYRFACNTFQGSILYYFNTAKYDAIEKKKLFSDLEFDDLNDFNQAITPLINIGLLLEKYVNDIPYVCLNSNFSYNVAGDGIIKLFNHLGEENKIVKKEKIEDDRSMAIDGTIIHIMKEKKECEHNELIKLIVEQLDRFKIDIEVVKKRIESLINKELISRDKARPDVYIYLATNPTE